jgi:hypothetical protein
MNDLQFHDVYAAFHKNLSVDSIAIKWHNKKAYKHIQNRALRHKSAFLYKNTETV